MTDRINAITVVLDKDMRVDDAESLLAAIRQLRGVLSVDPHVSEPGDHIAQNRARRELCDSLWEVLHPR